MSSIVDKKKINKKDSSKKEIVICPHCGEDVFINSGSMLGKISGEARIGKSVIMRELVERRWNKVVKEKKSKSKKIK